MLCTSANQYAMMWRFPEKSLHNDERKPTKDQFQYLLELEYLIISIISISHKKKIKVTNCEVKVID